MRRDINWQLSAAIACVRNGLLREAEVHLDKARKLIRERKVEHGLAELRDAKPTRIVAWDVSDVDAELGGES